MKTSSGSMQLVGIGTGVVVAASDHQIEKRTIRLPKIAPGSGGPTVALLSNPSFLNPSSRGYRKRVCAAGESVGRDSWFLYEVMEN